MRGVRRFLGAVDWLATLVARFACRTIMAAAMALVVFGFLFGFTWLIDVGAVYFILIVFGIFLTVPLVGADEWGRK